MGMLSAGEAVSACPNGATLCQNICATKLPYRWTCDLTNNGGSGSGAATVVTGYSASGIFDAWGTDAAGNNFCCSYQGTLCVVTLNGTAQSDSLALSYSSHELAWVNTVQCSTLSATVNGTAGDDVILGSNSSSHYSETLNGGDNNDDIDGQDGADNINGDNGLDVIDGGAGNDTISGGDSYDYIQGGDGNDEIYGNAMSDDICGDTCGDNVNGGDDVIWGGEGKNGLAGNGGNDTIYGNGVSNYICGDSGDDTLSAGSGTDFLQGGSGTDSASGGPWFDECEGEMQSFCESAISPTQTDSSGRLINCP